jgi:hypothetical protein
MAQSFTGVDFNAQRLIGSVISHALFEFTDVFNFVLESAASRIYPQIEFPVRSGSPDDGPGPFGSLRGATYVACGATHAQHASDGSNLQRTPARSRQLERQALQRRAESRPFRPWWARQWERMRSYLRHSV